MNTVFWFGPRVLKTSHNFAGPSADSRNLREIRREDNRELPAVTSVPVRDMSTPTLMGNVGNWPQSTCELGYPRAFWVSGAKRASVALGLDWPAKNAAIMMLFVS